MLKIACVRINIPTYLDINYGKRPHGATIIPWTIIVWSSVKFGISYVQIPLLLVTLNQTKGNAGAAAELAVKHAKYS